MKTKSNKSGRVYTNTRGKLNRKWEKLTDRWCDAHDRLTQIATISNIPLDSVDFKSYVRRTSAFAEVSKRTEELKAYVQSLENSLENIKTITAELDSFVWNDINRVEPKSKR